jgi:hypothetical protein
MLEVKTPEITGAFVAVKYSVAPKSVLAPWGRMVPSMSIGTWARFIPASIPAPPAWVWKSYGALDALTNDGFGPIWFVPIAKPVESDMTLLTP